MTVELTDKQRRQILRGDYPRVSLTPEQAKALPLGRRISLKAQVSVEVVGARRDKKVGDYYLEYRVIDFRPRFMARSASGPAYTHSIQLAVAEEGEDAVPEDYQRELTMRARAKHLKTAEEDHAEDLTRRQFKSFSDAARGVIMRQAKEGVDPGPRLARWLKELESRDDERAA